MKEVNALHNAFCIFAWNVDSTSTLTSDSDVECFVSLLTEFLESDILTYFYAESYVYA